MGIDLGDDEPTVTGPEPEATAAEGDEIAAEELCYEVVSEVFAEMAAPMRFELLTHLDRGTPFRQLPEQIQAVFVSMAEDLFGGDETEGDDPADE